MRYKRQLWRFISPKYETKESPKKTDYVILKSDKKKYKVLLADIVLIESLDNYIQVHTISKGKLICYETLSSMEQDLSGSNLLRIHRSFIINPRHIDAFTNSYIEIGNKKLPIGRNYKEEVLNKLS